MNDETKENIIAVLIVIVLIVGVWHGINYYKKHKEENKTEESIVSVDDDPMLGNGNSTNIVIEFCDFESKYCSEFANKTLPIIKKYAENGTLSFVFRDYPLATHPKAIQTARAAGCAYEQNKFWEYHDTLYNNMENHEIGDLMKYAEDIGLNISDFKSCFNSQRRDIEIGEDSSDAKAARVSGVPTIFVNNKKIEGVVDINKIIGLLS